MENPLATYFQQHNGRLIHKWMHYFEIYHRHFQKFRDRPVTVLEFGVAHGGSLQMWKSYFGEGARIVGVDINPECKKLEEDRVSIHIGDQADREFLKHLMTEVGTVDVVIEDGGHTMTQQIHTFEEVYPYVRPGGVFLIEDLHTSYWDNFGGGYRRPDTFIEYAKDLIDAIHAWHYDAILPNDYTRSVGGMHVYDSVIVFDKEDVVPPHHQMSGSPTLTPR